MNRQQARKRKVSCARCRKTTRVTAAEGWNVEFKAGRPAGAICPGCQTPEENAEAEINAATIDYSSGRVDAFGRMSAPLKIGDDDADA